MSRPVMIAASGMAPDGWWLLGAGIALVAMFVFAVGFLLGRRVPEQHREKPRPAPRLYTGPIWQQERRGPAGQVYGHRDEQQLRQALTAAQEDCDRAETLAARRLEVIDELRGELREKATELEQLRRGDAQ